MVALFKSLLIWELNSSFVQKLHYKELHFLIFVLIISYHMDRVAFSVPQAKAFS